MKHVRSDCGLARQNRSRATPANHEWPLTTDQEKMMNIEAHKKRTGYMPKLGTIAAILTAGLLAALSAGCAQRSRPAAAVPKAIEPMTIDMMPTGDVVAVFMGEGIPIAKERFVQAGKPARRYRFGTDPADPSVVCFWDESEKRGFCWPNNRHGWIQLTKGTQKSPSSPPGPDEGSIIRVYYQSDDGRSVNARPPIGAPTPIYGKEWFYGGASCPFWLWGLDGSMYCWDPCPDI
jgi:hypothetical protein